MVRRNSKFHKRQKQTAGTTKISIGQTLESNDLYLPHHKDTVSKTRPVIVVDRNQNEELVVVPGSTRNTPNTTYYGKHGIKYYRHNIEIADDEGKPIKQGRKFQKTKRCSKLPLDETLKLRNKVINHTRFASENRKKYNKFLQKKSRD